MHPRHWANLASASAITLMIAWGSASAETAHDAELGIPLPEMPALALQPAEAGSEPGMVTGTVVPSSQPPRGLQTMEVQPEPTAPDIAVEVPPVDLPPLDPALKAPTRAAEPIVPLPEMPKVVVEVPPGFELASEIAARAAQSVDLQRLPSDEQAAIVAAHAANENRPLWIEGKDWSAAAKTLVHRLEKAGEDGLRPTDYPLPVFEASDKASLAEADLKLSALAVLYARDARGARIDPRRLSKLITPKLYIPSATEVLSELAASPDAGAALAAYNPPHEGYRRLRAKLAELREHIDDTPLVRIPAGPAPRLGARDERVPLIRARLGLSPIEEPVFDRSTATALADFQKKSGLRADGILTERTIAALGMPVRARGEQDIVAQMERWRWLPPDLGAAHIWVNIPEFRMRVYRDGAVVHEARTIVGKPTSATPVFSHVMDHLVVNPSWYIPPSILKKEILPGLAADPDYAAKRGYVVTRGRNGNISVRQPPGERNALGWVKFMFPNDHAVYLHDTPNRRLFAGESRALSHGCVRVDNPFALADQVLGPEWTQARLKGLIGKGERTIRLTDPIQVHLVYNTHVVDASGRLTTYNDLYGFHRLVRQALDPRG